MVLGIVITVAGLIAMLSAGEFGYGHLSIYFKMAAATGFLITAWAAGAFGFRYGRIIFAGLVFSWFGDLFLALHGGNMFLAGLISFFLAHVAYCVAYASYAFRPGRSAVTLAVLILPTVLIVPWLWPGVPAGMKVPVLAYMAVISLMVALSSGAWGLPGGRLIVIGAVMFYLSDIFVARGRFVTADVYNGLIGLPLYFGGQLFLAASIAGVKQASGEAAEAAMESAPTTRQA